MKTLILLSNNRKPQTKAGAGLKFEGSAPGGKGEGSLGKVAQFWKAGSRNLSLISHGRLIKVYVVYSFCMDWKAGWKTFSLIR